MLASAISENSTNIPDSALGHGGDISVLTISANGLSGFHLSRLCVLLILDHTRKNSASFFDALESLITEVTVILSA